MKIAVSQFNPIVGDFDANAEKIIEMAENAKTQGANLLVTPAMSLSGYPFHDLLWHQDFAQRTQQAIEKIKQLRDIAVIIGLPYQENAVFYHVAMVIENGQILAIHKKSVLSSHHPLNEYRYFSQGNEATVLTYQNHRFALLIEEELQNAQQLALIRQQGAQAVISMHASPFYPDVYKERMQQAQQTALPVIYANLCGGSNEWVFDGTSFATDAQGKITFQAAFCQESLDFVVWEEEKGFSGSLKPIPQSFEAQSYTAIVMSLRDYIQRCGFQRVCLGLSGGMDSALVLALAVDAIGAEHCEVLLMPSQYTAQLSNTAATQMAEHLGVRYESIPISPIFDSFKNALSHRFAGLTEDVTEENLQARIRGTLLMALSNKIGALLLTTGNKSEVAMGYATLYGDMNGGFAPIKDLFKTQVYAVARWLNRERQDEIIPQSIIDRPPSAELHPNQTDQDSLPEYAVLDAMLQALMEENISANTLIQRGFSADEVQKTVRLLRISEYKRQQGAIGPIISRRAFDNHWQMPINHRFQ